MNTEKGNEAIPENVTDGLAWCRECGTIHIQHGALRMCLTIAAYPALSKILTATHHCAQNDPKKRSDCSR